MLQCLNDWVLPLRIDQRYATAPETASGHSTAVNAAIQTNPGGHLHDGVQFSTTDFKIIAQRTVALGHEPVTGGPIVFSEGLSGEAGSLIL